MSEKTLHNVVTNRAAEVYPAAQPFFWSIGACVECCPPFIAVSCARLGLASRSTSFDPAAHPRQNECHPRGIRLTRELGKRGMQGKIKAPAEHQGWRKMKNCSVRNPIVLEVLEISR